MPLNKLENFIKNTEGRILYVNPNDLDSTDSITNQGNSLTQPFKTIQRALLESARFSYLRGNDNDIVEKTTVLVYPGEHVIDNRPGFAIKADGATAKAVSPSGSESNADVTLTLTLTSNFDLTQEDNILYKFNSIWGGVVVPRGTSIVGLDLRKTKIRPKYVPNPTDIDATSSSIFKITGSCYFWQFSIFDGKETGLVYTSRNDFSSSNQSKPTFSHHKLTCFEYADGVNTPAGYTITDLDMYYSKLSNAFNVASGRDIDQKYPIDALGFSKQRPEWEIVGAFASDPISLTNAISGDGVTPGSVITVTTLTPHKLNTGTPIKIDGISVLDYNISTTVQNVTSDTQFTYLLPYVRDNLPAAPGTSSATVTIETDTVAGASPYIFNCSMRSVYGMNGLKADGSKASGFRSMVVAQFTGVSLQKDDRSFVKYNKTSRLYEGLAINVTKGSALARDSASLNAATVYHLDSDAVYRSSWETSHIKIVKDAMLQIVSVFAIGCNKHFDIQSGSDASITNSNSNFGQISLSAEGFKRTAFLKDNNAYVTNIITPKAITSDVSKVDWIALDVAKTNAVGVSSHLYIYGYDDADDKPPTIVQGYRVGAKANEELYVDIDTSTTHSIQVRMVDNVISGGNVAEGASIGEKSYSVTSGPTSDVFTIGTHQIQTGEKVRIFSHDGDLPENIIENTVYYAIRQSATQVKLASTKTNAENGTAISVYDGTSLTIISRVSDKESGDAGHPIQWDSSNSHWYIHGSPNSALFTSINGLSTVNTAVSYIKRNDDPRSLDEKIYKMRVVVPKESVNAKDPNEGFIIQESSSTGFRVDTDSTLTGIGATDYAYNKNPRFISTCSLSSNTVTVIAEQPHNLNVGDEIIVKNVTSDVNVTGAGSSAYNGTFAVTSIVDDTTFEHSNADIDGNTHVVGTFTNDTTVRNTSLPRFERSDLKSNYYIYRNEVISKYVYNVQDGIYHLFVLKADNAVPTEFTDLKYAQNVVDLYPQQDKDNINANPPSAVSFAKRSPLGDVITNDLKKSITRETADKFIQDFGIGSKISSVDATTGITTITTARRHGFGGINVATITAGASYTNGTYQNVKILNTSQTGTWNGATAKVVVSGGNVTSANIIASGSGYSAGAYFFDQTKIGAGNGAARLNVTTTGISHTIDDVIQTTGIGTVSDGHFRVQSIPSATEIALHTGSGDPTIYANQYAINTGPSVVVSSDTYDSATGNSTFSCASAHGLVSGNKFRVLDSSNNNLGDFFVKEKTSAVAFSAKTDANLAAGRILRHGLSEANATSDSTAENIAARGLYFYGGHSLILGASISTGTVLQVSLPNAGIGTVSRFGLGEFIQIDNESMRIVTSSLTGSGNNEISVIRGYFGTKKENHSAGSIIKKINPLAVEVRRPSIIRASGHTFEYIGYGPGNYSTGLPQVQVKTLSEREDFLAQAQERSAGSVVYTGMNSDGDFFIGNTKYSSSSGEQKTFDIPVPTVTGQDPSRLSVVFDEVVVKERIIVEGGKSHTVLSQFDGPVTFNQEIKLAKGAVIYDQLKVYDNTDSTSKDTGCFVVEGGIGIEKTVNIGQNLNVTGLTTTAKLHVTGISTFVDDVDCLGDVFFNGASANVLWNKSDNELEFADNAKATFGGKASTGDLQIYHSGSHSFITDTGTGDLKIQGAADVVIEAVGGQNSAVFNTDGAVELYWRGTSGAGKKLETTQTGVAITGELTVTGDITAFHTSDQRLKDNVTPIEDPLAKVLSISGNTFNWNEASDKEGMLDTGVIAQEIAALGLPGLATVRDDGTHAVRYEKLTALLIEAVKELSNKVSDLEQKIDDHNHK